MSSRVWDRERLAPTSAEHSWELFHENSKTSAWDVIPPQEQLRSRMHALWEALPYTGYPIVDLPRELSPLRVSLEEAILGRVTARAMRPCRLAPADVAALLHYAYGRTRSNEGTFWPRPFRTVPSAGAMYPLEVYLHTTHVDGLRAGLYHFDPTEHRLRLLYDGDASRMIAEALVQPNLAFDTAALFFITGMFERSVYKYGDRGYRFTLLEAGHVAQNLNLVATALGLGCINIGGYRDREIDALLGLDGLEHSTVYLVGVGERRPDEEAASLEL
jgi:SagB-type dehydrogenase family enzyme